jgi:N-acylglucosamine 2-epimerase/mannose-6-phosphate isomerase
MKFRSRQRDPLHDWIFTAALPWWAAHGVDRARGGYVEQMTMQGRDAGAPFKRTRVTARQIYVFSHAHLLGFEPGAGAARHGVEFLVSRTWNGPDRGFARRLTRDGQPLDPTPDLYDLAFVLFAFAWFHRATGEASARDWMHRTLDFIEAHRRRGLPSRAAAPGLAPAEPAHAPDRGLSGRFRGDR